MSSDVKKNPPKTEIILMTVTRKPFKHSNMSNFDHIDFCRMFYAFTHVHLNKTFEKYMYI